MRTFVLFFILALSPVCATAQSLWRNLPVGSTVEQVLQRVPGGIKPEKPSTLAGGAEALLEYRGFQLADIDFKAELYFEHGKLYRIFLKPITRPEGTNAQVAASKLRDSLQAKYGAPTSEKNTKSYSGIQRNAEWVQNGTIVKYSFNQIGGYQGVGYLQVLYMAPQDISNL